MQNLSRSSIESKSADFESAVIPGVEITEQKSNDSVSDRAQMWQKRSVEPIECQTGPEQAPRLASCAPQPPSLATRVLNGTIRGMQLILPVYSVAWNNNLANLDRLLQLGGVFGKLQQLVAANPEIIEKIEGSSDKDKYPLFSRDISHSLSQFKTGEMHPNDVISMLKASIKANIEANIDHAEAEIEHVDTLGRGTIAQVDHVRINGQNYAVKAISPKASQAIKADIDIAIHILFPLLYRRGKISRSDMHGLTEELQTFIAETNLRQEFNNTWRQEKIFEKLTTQNRYTLILTSKAGNHPVSISFKVPTVYPGLSSSQVLVMEHIDGCSLDRKLAVRSMLQSWQPAWNDHKSLDNSQIDQILTGLKEKILSVYLDAAQQSGFINADFQPGNMMLKLDGDVITVYFIDHGNCVEFKSLNWLANQAFHYTMVHSLFKFFHLRYDGFLHKAYLRQKNDSFACALPDRSQLAASLQSPVSGKLSDIIMDSTLMPWKKSFFDEFAGCKQEFGKKGMPSGELLSWCQEERSVADICGVLYQWVMSEWISYSGHCAPEISKDEFINGLSTAFFKAASESKDYRGLNETDKFHKAGCYFDGLLDRLGLRLQGPQLLFRRVAKQIIGFKNEADVLDQQHSDILL